MHQARVVALVGEDGFVGEDAVEGGAGDGELAGGAELVAAVEVEDVLDVMADHGVEREVVDVSGGVEFGEEFVIGGEGEVVWADNSVVGFEERGFEDGGKFAHVAGPVVLEEAGKSAGTEDDGALLIALADAIEQGLGEGSDVFSAQAQGGDGEADSGEAKCEVGQQLALTGHLAERSLRGGENDGAAGGTVLEALEDAEQEALSGRGEEVDAIEISKAGQGGWIGVGDEPLAGVAALKAGTSERGAAIQIAGEGLLARPRLALKGGYLNVRGGHLSLQDEFPPGGADSDKLGGLGGVTIDKGDAGGCGLELGGAIQGSQREPPLLASGWWSRPTDVISAARVKA